MTVRSPKWAQVPGYQKLQTVRPFRCEGGCGSMTHDVWVELHTDIAYAECWPCMQGQNEGEAIAEGKGYLFPGEGEWPF